MSTAPGPRAVGGRRPTHVIVTGTSGNIGRAIAAALCRDRCVVWGFDARPGAAPPAGRFAHVDVDITDEAAVRRAVERAARRSGGVDALVNCAGISPKNGRNTRTPAWDIDDDEWRRVFDVNLFGAMACCRAVIPSMIRRQRGSIVNIGSAMADTGASSCDGTVYPASNSGAHYCASKAALHNVTWSLARELGRHGIRVNCVAPGPVAGGMLALPARIRHAIARQMPLRGASSVGDIAEAVSFLLDERRSSRITGHVLRVNGGWIMR